nr:phosphate ABC transporter permease PstA [Methanocella paludicola]
MMGRSRRYLFNDMGIGLLWLSGALTLAILLVIIGYVLVNGIGVISWDFLSGMPKNMGRTGGIFPVIVGSVAITAIAILVATPLSVGAAIYMSEYAGNNILTRLVRFGADSLSGIPSIMFGMFGYIFFVYYLKMGYSLLAGGLTLALMALPIIMRVAEEAIKVVPESYRLGSMALGGSKWQTIRKVVLPTALPGILTGIILGMGRAVGETAAVYLTAGTVAKVPDSLFDPIRTMTYHTFILAMENISIENAFGTSAVLVIMILAITITSSIITRRYIAKLGGKT